MIWNTIKVVNDTCRESIGVSLLWIKSVPSLLLLAVKLVEFSTCKKTVFLLRTKILYRHSFTAKIIFTFQLKDRLESWTTWCVFHCSRDIDMLFTLHHGTIVCDSSGWKVRCRNVALNDNTNVVDKTKPFLTVVFYCAYVKTIEGGSSTERWLHHNHHRRRYLV